MCTGQLLSACDDIYCNANKVREQRLLMTLLLLKEENKEEKCIARQ